MTGTNDRPGGASPTRIPAPPGPGRRYHPAVIAATSSPDVPAPRGFGVRVRAAVPAWRWLRSVPAPVARGRRAGGPDPGGVPAAGGAGRRLARQPAARGRPLRLPVRRAGLLAVLQFAPYRDHGDVGHLAAGRRLARRASRAATRRASARSPRAPRCWSRSSRSSPGWCGPAAMVNFISESVMVGFKCGVALFLASTQLPKLFGFHGEHGDFWENSGFFLRHLHETNPAALAVGGTALAVLMLGKLFLKNKPVALFVVGRRHRRGDRAGAGGPRREAARATCRRGLPAVGLPALGLGGLNELLPLAFACFLLGAVETAAIGRMFAAKHGGRLDANQEFLALAAANLAAGARPRFAGQRRHVAIARERGRRGANPAFRRHRGRARADRGPVLLALAARPAAAGARRGRSGGGGRPVQDRRRSGHMWRNDRPEFVVAVAALLGVLGSGLLRGVMIGAAISLVQLVRRASQAARRGARSDSWHAPVLGPRAPPRQRDSSQAS